MIELRRALITGWLQSFDEPVEMMSLSACIDMWLWTDEGTVFNWIDSDWVETPDADVLF